MNNLLQEIIDAKINPTLALHNGRCELVKVVGKNVHVRLLGGCVGCPSAKLTLYNGVAPILKEAIQDIEEVVLEE